MEEFWRGVLWAGGIQSTVALVGICLFLLPPSPVREVGVALGALGARAAIGSIAGFLFAVPRAGELGVSFRGRNYSTALNSNLVQVSDWLTKIVVGVGLIQFREIVAGIGWMGERLGAALGDAPQAPGAGAVFGVSLVLAGGAVSFMLMYMWTSTRLMAIWKSSYADGAAVTGGDRD